MSKQYGHGLIVQCKLDLTTAADGSATTQAADVYIGLLYAVQLVDGTFDDGVDLTLTCEQGDLSIPLLTKADWNTDQMVYPRVLEALNTDGTALTTHTMPILSGKPKAVIAQGGNVKTGAVILYIYT
jgi:hypothetical protein